MSFQDYYASFFATLSFGLIFNVPKKSLFQVGIVGMLGWVMYSWLIHNYYVDLVFSTLISTFAVGVISQLLARLYKIPVTVYSVAGIIPLVPGGLAYDTMRHFVENDYSTALGLLTKTFMLSGAIAFGLVLSSSFAPQLRKKEPSIAYKNNKIL